MRNLFLALVLSNLLFAAWHRWLVQEPAAGSSAAERQLAGITLVREVAPGTERAERVAGRPADADADAGSEAADRAASDSAALEAAFGEGAAESVAQTAAEGGAEGAQSEVAAPIEAGGASALERCISVGPFRELAQAAAATSNLRASGYRPRQRVVDGEVWQGYWVYLEGFARVEEANEVLAELRAEGITDSLVIRGADSSLISLGIFSEINRAGRRREELRALGYEVTVSDRTGRATVYWVDVSLAPDQTLDVEALQTTGRIIRLEQRDCDDAA